MQQPNSPISHYTASTMADAGRQSLTDKAGSAMKVCRGLLPLYRAHRPL